MSIEYILDLYADSGPTLKTRRFFLSEDSFVHLSSVMSSSSGLLLGRKVFEVKTIDGGRVEFRADLYSGVKLLQREQTNPLAEDDSYEDPLR